MFKGETLRTLRVSKGLTQVQLSEKARVARRQISFYETGKATPDLDSAYRLAQVLDCKIELFFENVVSYVKQEGANDGPSAA